MNMPDVKYAIPDNTLTATIAALEYAQSRYEQEAVALFGAMLGEVKHDQDEDPVRLSRKLGWERLEKAEKVAELVDFYLHL